MSACWNQAAAYGKCVASTTTSKQELKKDLCAKEFEALKTCFINAVSDKASKVFTGFLEWRWSLFKPLFYFFLQAKKKAK